MRINRTPVANEQRREDEERTERERPHLDQTGCSRDSAQSAVYLLRRMIRRAGTGDAKHDEANDREEEEDEERHPLPHVLKDHRQKVTVVRPAPRR